MGEVTGRLSDLTILSSDNPRQEDPLKIISDIVVGLQKTNGKYLIEPDREKAIGLAMDQARAGDIVLLNRTKTSRNQTAQLGYVARRVSIAYDNSRTKNREALEACPLHRLFLQPHDPHIANPAF